MIWKMENKESIGLEVSPDILQLLNDKGLEIVIHHIFEFLSLEDLQCCQLVNKDWYWLVERLWEHHEYKRVGRGWSEGIPSVRVIQCEKNRSVCTISGIAVDESAIAVGLGSSGIVQLWSRRLSGDAEQPTKALWTQHGHQDGVYSVDMNTKIVASGGDDSTVKLWSRYNGNLLHNLQNLHGYIVWNVKLWMDQLFTAGYDCVVNYVTLKYGSTAASDAPEDSTKVDIVSVKRICGLLSWADALSCDYQGKYLVTHNDETFDLSIWDLSVATNQREPIEQLTFCQYDGGQGEAKVVKVEGNLQSFNYPLNATTITLSGHEDEVHCVRFLLPLVVSGSADKTIRLWSILKRNVSGPDETQQDIGTCLRILKGHEGKVWSVDIDRRRIVSGGRFGEIKVWSLPECIYQTSEDTDHDSNATGIEEVTGRNLCVHEKTTAVGQIRIEKALLISCDGIGRITLSDFWNLDKKLVK